MPIQGLVDEITQWLVPAVMALAVLTVALWLVFGPVPTLAHALVASVSVLIIACPCAMGLATPTSVMVGTGRAAELGDKSPASADVRAVANDHLTEIEAKIADLTAMRNILSDLVRSCAGNDRPDCPILGSLGG